MKSLNELLQKGKEIFDKFDKNKFNMNINDLVTIFMNNVKEIFSSDQIVEITNEFGKNFKNNWEDMPVLEFIKIVFRFIRQKEIQNAILQFLQEFADVTEKLFVEMKIYDKNLFVEIRDRLKRANSINQWYTEKNIIEYSDRNKYFFKVNKVLNSILLFREFFRNQENNRDNFSQNELYLDYFLKFDFLKLDTFLDSIERHELESLLFDCLLKFSYIIESHFKNIMEFLYKLSKFLKDEKIHKKEFKFNKIMEFLELDPILRHYRNCVFHSAFRIKYHPHVKDVQIEFIKKRRVLFKWSITDLFVKIVNILQLIRTIDLLIVDYYFKKEDIINALKELFIFINNLETDQKEKWMIQELEKTLGSEKMKKSIKEIRYMQGT